MSTTSSPVTSTLVSLPTPPAPRYHPAFTGSSGLNADVTLVARDGTHFRINATALRSASGVFETTLSLPQPVETEWKEPVIDSLDEDPKVLEDLLRIISGKEIPPNRLLYLDALQPRLLAAEKWDMRGALSIMRLLLRTTPDISSYPMRVYWLGCHFGWKEVTSAASKYTCNDDLFLIDKQPLRGQMDATGLLRLMNFHKDRKDMMKTCLFDTLIPSVHIASTRCSQNVFAEYQDFAWRVLEEMDHTPPAAKIPSDRLRFFSVGAQIDGSRCRSCNGRLLPGEDFIKKVHAHFVALQKKMLTV